ncbi:hypothetical protein K488DRAFT_71164 [Vararia minispora EC-137]|uniref:Uncharacterized protein n=1 Tax=Vararia minispora EC-137 TaxID=1314806 RepID=A0ACB8QJM6_9AGAM|nr:hypothetical protein K488DRAFT_71164 [Vararia minispora EC-137]
MSNPASKTIDTTNTLDARRARARMSDLRREMPLLSLLYDDDQEFAYPFENAIAALLPDTIGERHVSHVLDAIMYTPASAAQKLRRLHPEAPTPGCTTQVSTSYTSNGDIRFQHASSSQGMHTTEDELEAHPYTPHASSHETYCQDTPSRAYSTAPMVPNNTGFRVLAPEGTALGNASAEGQVPSAPGDAVMQVPKENPRGREGWKDAVPVTRAAARPYPAPRNNREALDTMRRQPLVSKALQTEDQRRCAMRYAPKLGKAGVLRNPETGCIMFDICKAHASGRLFVDRQTRDRHVQEHHGLLNLIGCPKCGKKVKRNIRRHVETCRM